MLHIYIRRVAIIIALLLLIAAGIFAYL